MLSELSNAGGRYKPGLRPHPDTPCRQGAAVMLYVLLPLEGRGALLAGSFVPAGRIRFWRFAIGQPYRLFLSLAGACLLAGSR
jgi:hypothetical protein